MVKRNQVIKVAVEIFGPKLITFTQQCCEFFFDKSADPQIFIQKDVECNLKEIASTKSIAIAFEIIF